MKKTILEYTMLILDKVSFDLNLLEKEYLKAIKLLSPVEIKELNFWVKKKGVRIMVLA